jgi:DNA-binding Lrp family transcriptional regulator
MAAYKALVVDDRNRAVVRRRLASLTTPFAPQEIGDPGGDSTRDSPASESRTRGDRQVAVRTLLAAHPDWADRRISNLCAVSPRTVGRVRAQLAETPDGECVKCADVRIGRDGRARPIDPAAQRERIVEELGRRPEASLRDIARTVGVSPETVRSVRAALTERIDAFRSTPPVNLVAWSAARDRAVRWEPDHSFRSRDDGAVTARFLERTDVRECDLECHAAAVPLSRVYEVSDEARRRAAFWAQLADRVELRAKRNRT